MNSAPVLFMLTWHLLLRHACTLLSIKSKVPNVIQYCPYVDLRLYDKKLGTCPCDATERDYNDDDKIHDKT
jgi:hypothetical protein